MVTYHLDRFLSGNVFAFMLLLSRVGAALMLLPGIGDRYVSPRTRMMLSFMICLLLLAPLAPRLPPLPSSTAEMAKLVFYEVVIGLFFGTMVRLIVSALDAAGTIIGMQTGLSNATMLNPALAMQSPLPSAFLGVAALTLIFITGLDHYLLRSVVALYDAFPPGGALLPGDMAQAIIALANRSFTLGIELASPFLIMGLLLYTGFGIMQRLMPQVQIFMVSMPLQIWGGLFLFALTITGILTVWMKFFDQSIASLMNP